MLHRHKSADITKNVADFFIDSKHFIAPYLVKLFNYIYDKGEYPESWTEGIIVPIFKKGDRVDPSNYRGITLVNIMAKIFSLTLRNRINTFCESEHIFNDKQFGFRDNHSTTDCIFILHSIIQKVLVNKSKLYCAFIDYEKAFDTVNHDALWIKLVKSGVSCKMLNMIKAIYANVKSCIRNGKSMSTSNFFDVSLGVKQGEPLSPLLFILFLNDISESIDFQNLTDKDVELLSIYMLLFADDIALFTADPNSLQSLLNNVFEYSCKWGLKININKTKICIFEKRKTVNNFVWVINGEAIDIVDSFTYLGINFFYTGNMKYAIQILYEQALKAYNSLLSLFSKVNMDIKTKLNMFDSLITPILLYGSEIWGIYNYKDVDRLHIKFCKYLLGVKPQTSNVAVLGELGRVSLNVKAKERSLTYWTKIMKNTDSPIYNSFIDQMQTLHMTRNKTWALAIKTLLDDLGFSNIWIVFNTDANYTSLFRQRLYDQYIQDWNETIVNQPKLYYYKMFKIDFKYEKYLDVVNNTLVRKDLSRFRLSSHSLEIESGRYNNIDRCNRICKCCNLNVVESEYHFISCCPLYRTLRHRHGINVSFPSIQKFINIMSCSHTKTIRNVAKYVHHAMLIRQEKLNDVPASF